MNPKYKWPSMRALIIVGILLVAGAIICVFWPPVDPRARAEKLYLDSWFITSNGLQPSELFDGNSSDGDERAIRMLEKALEICPGNSLYEQALVWQYPPSKLPDLLEKRGLGHRARILALGLICDHKINEWSSDTALHKSGKSADLPSAPSPPGDRSTTSPPIRLSAPIGTQVSAEETAFKLKCLNELSKQDPTNALPRYRKAYVLMDAGRLEESIQEVKIASKLAGIRYYFPQVSKQVQDSLASPNIGANIYGIGAECRRLTSACVSRANELLRQGRVQDACDILEACCRMGVHVSSAEPRLLIFLLEGKAIFDVAGNELEPTYKDFGMADQVAAFRKTDQVYQEALKWARPFADKVGLLLTASILRRILLPAFLFLSAMVVVVMIVITAIGLGVAAMIRRRRHLPSISIRPWHYSQPIRLAIIFYAFSLEVLLVGWFGLSRLGADSGSIYLLLQLIIILPPLLLQLVLGVLIIKALHRAYIVDTGERVGFLRFSFRMSANVAAWRTKCFLAALGMQSLVLLYLFLATVIVYKPMFGIHPWQLNRLSVCLFSQEDQKVSEIATKLDASIRQWPGK